MTPSPAARAAAEEIRRRYHVDYHMTPDGRAPAGAPTSSDLAKIIDAAFAEQRKVMGRAVEVLDGVGRIKDIKGDDGYSYACCPVCHGQNGKHASICGIGEALTRLRETISGLNCNELK